MIKIILVIFIFLLGNGILWADSICHPLLWPNNNFLLNNLNYDQQENLLKLQKKAIVLLSESSHAIPVLVSAGKTDINDPKLVSSRLAFKDANNAAILALAFTLSHNPKYLHKTRDILLDWSIKNKPTGNPIDETSLEGLVWAYDLISCDLSNFDKNKIELWLNNLRLKKLAWRFGPNTTFNNHRIHQMKMLLLLDKVLHRTQDWQRDLSQTQRLALINLNVKTGESLDYKQRNALYYQNYDLEAWLEISLISHCCGPSIDSAFKFLSSRILNHDVNGEFVHSQAKIDALRAGGGFDYAKTGGTFDVSKSAPTILTYYTVSEVHPPAELWDIVQYAKPSPWLIFLANRRTIWHQQIHG